VNKDNLRYDQTINKTLSCLAISTLQRETYQSRIETKRRPIYIWLYHIEC